MEKAILEYPSKYGPKLAEVFEKYAKQVIKKTKEEIGRFYNENDLAYIWVWCIKCPHCSQRIPLINHSWLANTNKNKIGIRFTITQNDFKTQIIYNMKPAEGKYFTQKGGTAICINCRNGISYQAMVTDIAKRRDREMIVKQRITKLKEREYILVTEEDKNNFEKASQYLQTKWNEFEAENLIPNEDILASHGKTNSLWNYGIMYWRDFFSERQLLMMVTIIKNIKYVCNKITDKDLQKILGVYLGFLLCKHIDSNSLGVRWNHPRETPEPVLSLRRPSIIYNHAEINSFQRVRGSIENSLYNISNAIYFASKNSIVPRISLESVLKLSSKQDKYDLIITDPPYLDDIQYGEVSDFFYIWLSRILKEYFLELPSRIKLDEDLCLSIGRFGNKKLARNFFEQGLKKSFVSMNKLLKDDGLLVIFFAHSSIEAWNLFLECIRESKFYVVSSYAIHTEMVSGMMARGKTSSFMSSIVIVCRKLSQDSVGYFEDIMPLVEGKIKEILNKISTLKLLSISLTDLLIMMYGKVLETATNHTELKSYIMDFKPNFESLISNSRDFILNEIVKKLTGKSINLLGSHMSFYLITKIFYHGLLAGDDLLKVTKTYGLVKEQIEKDTLAKNEDGQIRLYYLHERIIDKKPEEVEIKNIYEQLRYLAQTVDTKGAIKLTSILSHSNFRMGDIKQVILLLLKSFTLRLNKKEQLVSGEQKELKIIETLADRMGIRSESSFDSFIR